MRFEYLQCGIMALVLLFTRAHHAKVQCSPVNGGESAREQIEEHTEDRSSLQTPISAIATKGLLLKHQVGSSFAVELPVSVIHPASSLPAKQRWQSRPDPAFSGPSTRLALKKLWAYPKTRRSRAMKKCGILLVKRLSPPLPRGRPKVVSKEIVRHLQARFGGPLRTMWVQAVSIVLGVPSSEPSKRRDKDRLQFAYNPRQISQRLAQPLMKHRHYSSTFKPRSKQQKHKAKAEREGTERGQAKTGTTTAVSLGIPADPPPIDITISSSVLPVDKPNKSKNNIGEHLEIGPALQSSGPSSASLKLFGNDIGTSQPYGCW